MWSLSSRELKQADQKEIRVPTADGIHIGEHSEGKDLS
jgi:hypothetical protein